MIAIIGVYTANLVSILAVPLRRWDRKVACEGDSAAPGRQAMLLIASRSLKTENAIAAGK